MIQNAARPLREYKRRSATGASVSLSMKVGATITKGQPFGVVESTKAVSELFAPVTGKVTKVNQALVEAPEGINDDPHEKGWMIEIEMSAPNEAGELLSAKQYEELLANEQ